MTELSVSGPRAESWLTVFAGVHVPRARFIPVKGTFLVSVRFWSKMKNSIRVRETKNFRHAGLARRLLISVYTGRSLLPASRHAAASACHQSVQSFHYGMLCSCTVVALESRVVRESEKRSSSTVMRVLSAGASFTCALPRRPMSRAAEVAQDRWRHSFRRRCNVRGESRNFSSF